MIFGADDLAAAIRCDPEAARNLLEGASGFVDLGLVTKAGGRYTVTEKGLALSRALADMRHDDAEQVVRTTVVANAPVSATGHGGVVSPIAAGEIGRASCRERV